jgi:peroxisomal 2,4-dienoyl-CoA reductase
VTESSVLIPPNPPSRPTSSLSLTHPTDNKVVFCTGGAGTICSAQVRALVCLGANACIIGRNVSKTESMAKSIATARTGAKVIGIGAVDVRKIEDLEKAVETCVKELGGIDFVMYVPLFRLCLCAQSRA